MTSQLILGNCVQELPKLPENSIDTCITDPPYELGFMGKSWDSSGVAFDPATWRAVYRVLKPGAFLLCFGGTRTFHRITCAIEDAGFEIRDCMMWLYGSGFPKSLDISKAMDRAAGAEREVVGTKIGMPGYSLAASNGEHTTYGRGIGNTSDPTAECAITAPATEAAKLWDGWGTALKPAWEPIIVAMKPCDGTFAENALQHGVAGLHIDGGRIPHQTVNGGNLADNPHLRGTKLRSAPVATGFGRAGDETLLTSQEGRFPANLLLDEEAGMMLDEQSGERPSGGGNKNTSNRSNGLTIGSGLGRGNGFGIGGDSGGASRFFYCAKAGKKERGEGNTHPTVKPLALMEYLCCLTRTPTGGVVLDPFLGSGTTAVAALRTGRSVIGIEMDEAYLEIARCRVATVEPTLL